MKRKGIADLHRKLYQGEGIRFMWVGALACINLIPGSNFVFEKNGS